MNIASVLEAGRCRTSRCEAGERNTWRSLQAASIAALDLTPEFRSSPCLLDNGLQRSDCHELLNAFGSMRSMNCVGSFFLQLLWHEHHARRSQQRTGRQDAERG